MRKRYTSYENEKMFNVVYSMIKNSKATHEGCRGAVLNKHTAPILNELKKYIKDRSDDALLIQISLVTCACFFPDRLWSNHSRAVKYRQMFEALIKQQN